MSSTVCHFCGPILTPSESITDRPTARPRVCPKCGAVVQAADELPAVAAEQRSTAGGGSVRLRVATYVLWGLCAVNLSVLGWYFVTRAVVHSVKVITGVAEVEGAARRDFEKAKQDIERSRQEFEKQRARTEEDWTKQQREAEKAAADLRRWRELKLHVDPATGALVVEGLQQARQTDSKAAAVKLREHLESLKRASRDGTVPASVQAGVRLLKNVHELAARRALDRQSAKKIEASPDFQQGLNEVIALLNVGGDAIPEGTEESDITLSEAYARFMTLLVFSSDDEENAFKAAARKGIERAQKAAKPQD